MDLLHRLTKTFPLLRQQLPNVLLVIFFSVAVIQLLSLYMNINADDGQWERFKTDHHCSLLVNDRGSQRLSWQCDDGEIYYRWRQQR